MQATGCQLLQEKVVGDSVKEFAEVLSLSFILQVGHPVIGYQVSQAAAASDKPRTAGLASLVSCMCHGMALTILCSKTSSHTKVRLTDL